MADLVSAGTWVEIHLVVLPSGERAPQVPEDTQQVPLEMRVKGLLIRSARLGEEAEIKTPTGRLLEGTLTEINPAYTHNYGPPIAELLSIGEENRAILRKSRQKP